MPQVDVETPAHEWRLGPVGVAGAGAIATGLGRRYVPSRIVASREPKATQTGAIIAERLHLPLLTPDGLHEHDRRAIRFLPADEFTSRIRDVIVSHGTVISLFVGARANVDAAQLWATLGLPSYVALELPSHRIIEIVAAV